jgi:hypothetical protein
MQTVNLPEDVLVIHYDALAPGSPPLARLQVLAAIGCLLAAQDQSHNVNDLLTDVQARLALQSWLTREEASRFWQSVEDQIVSVRACEKHVLVGTRHLMDDLAALMSQPHRPRLADLDALWRAASVFTDQHIGKKNSSRGVTDEH